MYLQVTRSGETFAAVRALKRPLTCVTAHVKRHFIFALESFATFPTNLLVLFLVAQLMLCQTGDRAEHFPTSLALFGNLGRMTLLVAPHLTHTGVLLPRRFAREVADLCVTPLMLIQQVHFFKAFTALRTVKPLDDATTPVS